MGPVTLLGVALHVSANVLPLSVCVATTQSVNIAGLCHRHSRFLSDIPPYSDFNFTVLRNAVSHERNSHCDSPVTSLAG